jgi:hypothetical protein
MIGVLGLGHREPGLDKIFREEFTKWGFVFNDEEAFLSQWFAPDGVPGFFCDVSSTTRTSAGFRRNNQILRGSAATI